MIHIKNKRRLNIIWFTRIAIILSIVAFITPFIITENLRLFYYRGLQNWQQIEGYLLDTCLTAQDEYKAVIEYFRVV